MNNCIDRKCPVHGSLKTRKHIKQGIVLKRNKKDCTVIVEKIKRSRKYNRFYKKQIKYYCYLSECMTVSVGKAISFKECRKLSKTKTHVIWVQ